MPAGTMEEHVILGRMWCYLTNCQIDWQKKQAKMVYKGNAAQVSLLLEDASMQPPTPTEGDSTTDKVKGKLSNYLTHRILFISTIHTHPLQNTTSTHTTSPKNYALFTQHEDIIRDEVGS